MALGSNPEIREQDLWLTASDLPRSPGHPFYERVQEILQKAGFDRFCEELCRPFYSDQGRPSIPPGNYFRMLMVGFFEGIDSERGIEWRCTDSLSLRAFLLLDVKDRVPDHSSLSRIRHRIDLETHERIFSWVLERLAEYGLLQGRNLGLDASSMEANAAMRSIVRKKSGESYQEYLIALAKASGIESPTKADLKKLDRKRKKKTSNDDWESPDDPDARISKLKDGRTKLAYKPEHAVDLDSGAVVSAEVHHAGRGDTSTGPETLADACERLIEIGFDPREEKRVVADKGYYQSEYVGDLHGTEIVTYIADPTAKTRRNWTRGGESERESKRQDQSATYANRRRMRTARGQRLYRKRNEVVERSFAQILDSGGMRRTHLRGRENVQKRYLVHVAAYNLGLILRKLCGAGKPREWASRAASALVCALIAVWTAVENRRATCGYHSRHGSPSPEVGRASGASVLAGAAA
jgi:transposase